uniref:Uncharacterized protein n=1 Tax=Avena sativa TaxID=4498 RepID=A0ACD5TY26_AVESA
MAKRNEKGSVFLVAALAAVISVLAAQATLVVAVGYTDGDKIQKVVYEEVMKAKAKAPGFIRLVFHDCFVRGCDASVLLLKTPTNPDGKTEKDSPFNGGLRGMEVIDIIRNRLLASGTKISCADAIVFAAREAANILSNGNIKYPVDGPGRKDGVVSSIDDPPNFLPSPSSKFVDLLARFKVKELNMTDLVALSSAHCIGVFHQTPIMSSNASKTMSTYALAVAEEASTSTNGAGVKINVRDMGEKARNISMYQPNQVNMSAVGVLDNSYFNANVQNMVPFDSDFELTLNGTTLKLMNDYKKDAKLWKVAFEAAMTKLSNTLKAPAGSLFEEGYRVKCNATNYDAYPHQA